MLSNLIVRIGSALLLSWAPCWALSVGQQSYLGGGIPYEVRDAVLDDASDVVDVFVDAFAPSASFKYIHQFQDQYPGYYRRCQRQALHELLAQPSTSDLRIKVLAIPDRTSERGTRVVSASIWDLSRTPNQTLWSMVAADGDDDCSQHLDVNTTRADHFVEQMKAVEKEYLMDVYERQVYLSGLATHPTWDGNGFAAVLLQWGIALAHQSGVPVTLIATPAGYPLYGSVGFKDIKNATVELLDGLGSTWFEVMVLDSP